MDLNTPFIRQLKETSGLPKAALERMAENGTSLEIPTMTILNHPLWLNGRSYYLEEGVVREFYIDKKGNEHTMRFIQAPSLISPSWTEYFLQSETIITSQALTPLKGTYWTLESTNEVLKKYHQHYKLIIWRIILDLRDKNKKEIRLCDYTAPERYMFFLKDFPGVVNQIPLKYIASYLSVTPETISRIRADITSNSKK